MIAAPTVGKEENHNNPEDKGTEQKFFHVHTSVVFQLGESLISDVVQALVELVKNAYDADATFARAKSINLCELRLTEIKKNSSNGWTKNRGYRRYRSNSANTPASRHSFLFPTM